MRRKRRIKKLGLKKGAVFLKKPWSYEDQKENKYIRERDLWNVILIKKRKYLPDIYFSTRIFSTMTNSKHIS